MQLESCWLRDRCGSLCEVMTESQKVCTQPVVSVAFFFFIDRFAIMNAFINLLLLFFGHSEVPEVFFA